MEKPLIFLRKLNAQELGYRKGAPKKAGRYFLISKRCLAFFPPLSTTITNDHVFINVLPPNSDKLVLCNFVYHNDKITEAKNGGRDEFRMYLNDGIDPNGDFFKPEDIVAFSQAENNAENFYKIYHFPPTNAVNSEYQYLAKLLKDTGTTGAHALIPAELLPFIKTDQSVTITQKIVPEKIKDDAFKDPIQTSTEKEEDQIVVTRAARNAAFRDLVLFFYDYRCAITKDVIKYGDLMNLEAAHIIPRYVGGGNNPSNGIALSRDLHWAFDKGFFTLDPTYSIDVHPDIKHSRLLQQIHGQKLFTPEDSRAKPNQESIKWHNDKVYGIFKRSSDVQGGFAKLFNLS